jgi:Raf kinase inhibitor-like YbhB/YbcL family protein
MRPALLAVVAAVVPAGVALVPLAAQGGSAMQLTSPAFSAGAEIPSAYTCEGADHPPALAWSGAPAGTKSFALIVDDPDAPDPRAPKTTWVHWVVYNLPPSASGIPEGGKLPAGAVEGMNDFKRAGWGGPCPPIGRHRYVFKLYALDTVLELGKPTKAALEKAMHGHELARGELVGTYQKKKG